MAVPVVSLAVPFVLYRMWTWRGMFFSRILRNGFLLFAFMGLVAAYYSLKGNMNLTIVMMVAPPACAMLLLCGLLRSSGLLVIGGWGIVIIVNAVFSDRPFFSGIGLHSSLYYMFSICSVCSRAFPSTASVKPNDVWIAGSNRSTPCSTANCGSP